MDSLLSQDISFFEMTRTGDLTSRLSSDTTLVGSQVTVNVSIFLRSVVQSIGVLIFMAMISWQLTLLAFITIPAVTVLSKWYGRYIRSISKAQQKKVSGVLKHWRPRCFSDVVSLACRGQFGKRICNLSHGNCPGIWSRERRTGRVSKVYDKVHAT